MGDGGSCIARDGCFLDFMPMAEARLFSERPFDGLRWSREEGFSEKLCRRSLLDVCLRDHQPREEGSAREEREEDMNSN